jgi:iron-sulfur cluster assembly protein
MVSLTPQAAEKVAEFRAAQGGDDADAVLRLGIRGGGCSGFQYQLALDHQRAGDELFESHGEFIVVDSDALAYVDGSTISYREGLMESGFDVENPKATSACGCGSSFRVDGGDGCSVEEPAV